MRNTIYSRLGGQQGMTLLEVLVTLGVLAVFMAGTLQFYSTSFRTLNAGDAALDLTHDAHAIMSALAEDIRRAETFVADVADSADRTVVAAMRMVPNTIAREKEVMVVYSLNDDHPAHLFRTVIKDSRESSLELSSSVQSLRLHIDANQPVRVELVLERTVAGRKKTFEASSAYTMRF
jgi:prepilin-type N-terminal cleavage/methylation domain-containing protein